MAAVPAACAFSGIERSSILVQNLTGIEDMNMELREKLAKIRARRRTMDGIRDRQRLVSTSLEVEKNRVLLEQERSLQDFRSILASQMSSEQLLDLLMQWNALNECFYISHAGPFGTINGLRLGLESVTLVQPVEAADTSPAASASENRRYFTFMSPSPTPSAPPLSPIRVPWTEINAALGQVALLLLTLEKYAHSGIQYRHQILHQGSTTKIGIRRAGGNAVSLYNLYHDDSFQLFGRRNFNIAIECLCECVLDAAEAIQKRDRTITLPYALERAKGELLIGRLPTAISFGQDGTEWTRAMKYLLTDIKHMMTFRLFLSSNCSH